MTKFNYACEEDKNFINRSYSIISNFIFGKNNTIAKDAFKKIFKKRVSEVNIYPQGTINEHVSPEQPGAGK